MAFPAIKKDKYSYADYLTWDDGIRREIIDGVVYEMKFEDEDQNAVYDMSPAPNRRHQEISGNLFLIISTYLKGKKCKVYSAPFDVRLSRLTNENEITNVVQPDISVFCDHVKLDDKGAKGNPDWIIEILSKYSVKNDLGRKMVLYQSYGVKEYWVIDPKDEKVMVYILNESGNYSLPKEYSNDGILTSVIFSDLGISLQEVFAE